MITTWKYGGKREIEKDGKKGVVPISSTEILNQMGAFIKVTITHPRTIQKKLKEQERDIPAVTVNALIDTGASNSVITPKIADQLNLVHTGYQNVTSVQDEQKRPIYYGFIMFPWGKGKEIPVVCCPLKNFDCLIGRDILMHWYFTYNGPDGSVVVCD